MKRPSIIIYALIMIACTAFVWGTAVWTFQSHQLPLDMEEAYRYNPDGVGVLLVLAAIALTVCSVFMILYAVNEKWRRGANISSMAAWIFTLVVFAAATSSGGYGWIYFLIVTVPPLMCLFCSSPKIAIPGEQW